MILYRLPISYENTRRFALMLQALQDLRTL